MTKSTKGKAAQIVAVDAGKLAKGLKATFEGVAMVFDALGVDADIASIPTEPKQAGKTEKPEKAEKPAKEEKTDDTEQAMDDTGNVDAPVDAVGDDGSADESEPDVVDEVEPTAADEEPAEEQAKEQATAPAPEPKKASAVTLDDVTKIIVQKIKKDRSNNEKIGQILKTYGVVKVGELDEEKYEAFLTDVAAL